VTTEVSLRRAWSVLLVAVATALLATLSAGSAAAHGAPTAPISRAAACGGEGTAGDTAACQAALNVSPQLAAQWDNIRVAGVNGRDREVIRDGQLCSAGLERVAGLDLPRTDWPSTRLDPGAEYTFSYRGTIPHTGTFRLYVTRPGYAPDQPLTWDDLEVEPFAEVTDPPLEEGAYSFAATLPGGLTGSHLIYTIWQNSSSEDTYYSCSDVVFGDAAGTTAAAVEPAAAAGPPPPPSPTAGPAPAQPVVVQPVASVQPAPMPALVAGAAVVLIGALIGGLVLWWVRRRRPGRHGR
jgi:chitin-binding protein